MQIAGCQPDSGKPTVRDERGAYGNVSYGGIRNPLHTLKRCMSETLCLRLRAPYFYPTVSSCAGAMAAKKVCTTKASIEGPSRWAQLDLAYDRLILVQT